MPDRPELWAPGPSAAELADALRSVLAAWDAATRDGGGACGVDVVERAYTELHAAWFTELGAHLALLDRAGRGQ